ncbi:hypothetical protein PIB30_079195 [Stylosanthes scabra]|uniref:Tify domain-containing protein n=1 Tax=Stylosanthes scabra TaxID=79078 RepID=A0ABU6WPC7_9FABA|nr:hypothetical protein [Stylosanthes scabra]
MGHAFNLGNGSSMPMHQIYGLSMSEPFNRTDFISMDQSYQKVDSNLISLGSSSYPKGHENFIPMGAIYSKSAEDFMNISPFYGKGIDHMLSLGPTGNSSSSLAAHAYNNGESGSMPFVALTGNPEPEPNPSVGIMNGYNLLMENQNLLAQGLDSQNKDQISPDAEQQAVKTTQTTGTQTDTTKQKKNKEKKTRKASSNNFPSNVKSLLSTGIFDGVPVKYVSWSREKTLGAVIKGTGYVCSCDECKEPKPLNAYEFERHAGSKTKHPNNHIYFENGKTVYGVVQELKNTPQEMLFDVIQNATGSTVNQKNFQSWKASYQAAAKELQRIYRANEVTTL